MDKIDAQLFFWEKDSKEIQKLLPFYPELPKEFLPVNFAQEMYRANCQGAVVIQIENSWAHADFLLKLGEKNDFIQGIVSWIDFQDPELEKNLANLANIPLVKGLGHNLVREENDAFLLDPKVQQGTRALTKFGYCLDIGLSLRHLPIVEEFAAQVSELPLAIRYLGSPMIDQQLKQPWAYGIQRLAQYPQIVCKLSGWGYLFNLKNRDEGGLKMYLDTLLEHFGADRLLFGSDWPFGQHLGSYSLASRWLEDYLQSLSDEECQKILVENTKTFYNL